MHPVTLVLHSTQGGSASGAWVTMNRENSWSHDILSVPEGGTIIPCIPHNQYARSLVNLGGGVETNNRGGVIQVEIVGFANRASAEYYGYVSPKFIIPEWGDKELGMLADYIIRCHMDDGLPIVFPKPFLHYPASYGVNGIRYTFNEWAHVEGIIGHQHVPENSHGDPGELNVRRLSEIIASKLYVQTYKEDDMIMLTPVTGISDGVFTFNGSHVRWIRSGIEYDLLKSKGVTEWLVNDQQMRAILLTAGKVGPSPDSGAYQGAW